jgi:hypothetical protein
MKYTLFLVSALCALTLGAPIERRATPSSVSCGGRSYSASQINGAISNGVNDRASSSSYPHRYNNYEGFDFSDRCSSTSFQEFPLKSSPYTGGEFAARGRRHGEARCKGKGDEEVQHLTCPPQAASRRAAPLCC